MPKLTLSANKEVIEQAKRIAAAQHTSVSAIVSRVFRGIAAAKLPTEDLPPITRTASGLVRLPADVPDRDLLSAALADRYGV